MSHRRLLWSVIAALFVCSAFAPGALATEAAVVSMNGPADVEKSDGRVTGVTTGADTTVLLQVDAAHELTVYQLSRLTVGDEFRLHRGTVRAKGTLTIVTANASVRVVDGELTVAFDHTSATTTVEVFDDEAEMRGADDRAVAVPAGQMVRIAADSVTGPTPIVAEGVAAARHAPAVRTSERNLPAIVAAVAWASVLLGLLVVRRARALAFASGRD